MSEEVFFFIKKLKTLLKPLLGSNTEESKLAKLFLLTCIINNNKITVCHTVDI